MGWNPESESFQILNEEQARNWDKGPVFHEGEEVELKGLTFIVVDIAPGQIKLKPKRKTAEALKKELEAAMGNKEQRGSDAT